MKVFQTLLVATKPYALIVGLQPEMPLAFGEIATAFRDKTKRTHIKIMSWSSPSRRIASLPVAEPS